MKKLMIKNKYKTESNLYNVIYYDMNCCTRKNIRYEQGYVKIKRREQRNKRRNYETI